MLYHLLKCQSHRSLALCFRPAGPGWHSKTQESLRSYSITAASFVHSLVAVFFFRECRKWPVFPFASGTNNSNAMTVIRTANKGSAIPQCLSVNRKSCIMLLQACQIRIFRNCWVSVNEQLRPTASALSRRWGAESIPGLVRKYALCQL